MRVLDDHDVLEGLRKARTGSNSEDKKRFSFLLVLVRKFAQKHYEFIYYPADSYERVDDVFTKTPIVLEDGTLSLSDSDEPMVWVGSSAAASFEDDDESHDDHQLRPSSFASYYVGKAIFHTASGESLMKLEASPGWKEALKQKYLSLDVESYKHVETNKQTVVKNRTAAKAAAAAAVGSSAAVTGTSVAAGAMGFTANGIASGSIAASIMSAEAVATGGGVAAGGFTATMQSIGAAGIMANPVGLTVAAVGAVGGLGAYYMLHRRNQAKQQQQQQKEKEQEDAAEEGKTDGEASNTEEDSDTEIPYQQLANEDYHAQQQQKVDFWVVLSAKRVETEESDYSLVPSVCQKQVDAEREFLQVASNTSAKALFSPDGKVVRHEAPSDDQDGWYTALALNYDYLVDTGKLTAIKSGEGAKEGTPLLADDW